MEPQNQLNPRNMIMFFVIAAVILVGWQFFIVNPQLAEDQARLEAEQVAQAELQETLQEQGLATNGTEADTLATLATLRQDGAGTEAKRLPLVISDSRDSAPRSVDDPSQPNVLEGSINVEEGRIDAAKLVQYRETLDPDSPVIELLKPSDREGRFYIDFDWQNITTDASGTPIFVNDLFDQPWQVSGSEVTRDSSVTLTNEVAGASFTRTFEVVDNYLVRVTQTVTNGKDAPLLMAPVTRVARDGATERDRTSFTGPVVSNGDKFYERNYDKVRNNADANGTYEVWDGEPGWIGMTDKYWMVAAVPQRPEGLKSETSRMRWTGGNAYSQTADDFIVDTRPTNAIQVNPGETITDSVLVFIGAKEVATLNQYRDEYDIKFLSRGIDFSFLYFITQPFAGFLIWLNSLIGNVGWAIIVMTLIVKAILFWPNDRAYRSMERMKLLQPQVQEINERYADDQQTKSQKMMELYRDTGVNPLGGCLPIFIQMPVFLALYRVLNVTLETRHAPWLLWIEDLSARDPLTLFSGFGLFDLMNIPIPAVPDDGFWSILNFINIGPLAILMGLSMVVQQRMSPPPTDPTQRQVFAMMPIIFTFVMANFAAGLVIYWTANNLLTIIQQFIIKRSIANDESLKMQTSETRQKKRFDEQKKRKT